jgi:hypothetical protein
MTFRKGHSGNPGGRPKVLTDVQELARQHVPAAVAELARLAIKAKSETARIAACRELLDHGGMVSRDRDWISPRRPALIPFACCWTRSRRHQGTKIGMKTKLVVARRQPAANPQMN